MLLGNRAYILQEDNAALHNMKIKKKSVKILRVHFTYDFRPKQ